MFSLQLVQLCNINLLSRSYIAPLIIRTIPLANERDELFLVRVG